MRQTVLPKLGFCHAVGNAHHGPSITQGLKWYAVLPLPYIGISFWMTARYSAQKFATAMKKWLKDEFYLPNRVIITSRSLSRKVHRLAVRLTRSIASALEANHLSARNYSAIENRAKVVQHLARERSYKLAIVVKTRDGFTCQICGFNFAEAYGELGRGFAEAHHIVPLSNLRKGVKTRTTDLICVCSNCHRMLHRMDGHLSDVNRLRQLIR
jgi:predicted HNH restriction endonuclease